jgi:hypothetical protein
MAKRGVQSRRPPKRSLRRRIVARSATDPRHRPPKGLHPFGTRLRRLFWSWWPWFGGATWAFADDRFGLGIGLGAMAAFSYLSSPVETPPQFGLDHDLYVESEEFRRPSPARRGRRSWPGIASKS